MCFSCRTNLKIVLDTCQSVLYKGFVSPRTYTTDEAAKAVEITRATLQSWIQKGVVQPPEIQPRPGKPPVRMWDASDITRLMAVKKLMQKNKTGRPRKKSKKSKV